MKRIRNLITCILIIIIITTSGVSIAEMASDIDCKACSHGIYDFIKMEIIYHGDVDGKCKKTVIEYRSCLICSEEFTQEVTLFDSHVSFIFKASCDRATHIYYCKCRCGKGMPTIREACPRPGVGCPDILSLDRRIGRIDMPY